MTYARTILALLFFAATGAPTPSVDAGPTIEIEAITTEQAGHAEWALTRFAYAGLQLPSLRIVFHDSYQACGTREGVLRVSRTDRTAELTIHSCERDPGRLRRNLLHELSHAWEQSGAISASTRAEFLRLRGLQSWDSDALPWNERGEEQAAEIMAWGLMERHAPIPTDVGDYGAQDPDRLAQAFTLLTGRIPLFGGDHEADGSRDRSPALANSTAAAAAPLAVRAASNEFAVLTDDHRAMIEWALDRYTEAGLDLGAVSVGVYDDPTVCGDRRGFYRQGVVTVCATNDDPSVQDAWRRHTLLHELAHAWADLHLTDQQRRAFVEARGAATWRNRESAWEDRATEHAAEIIAWAIADSPYYPHTGLADRSCDSFMDGYRMLTGSPPPHGHTDHCD